MEKMNRKQVKAAEISFVFLLWLSIPVVAQQKPQYTQYILNQYVLNPALTGIENYTDIRISHRNQWAGLSGAPQTTYLTAHMPIGKKDYRTTATSAGIPGLSNNVAYRSAAKPHHGIGIQVVNDESGPLSTVNALVTYAYHIGITDKLTLSTGFGAGINRLNLNVSMLDFNSSETDPVTSNGQYFNSTKPDLSSGLFLYSNRFFAGISALQIIPSSLNITETSVSENQDGFSVPHLFGTAGYRFNLNNDFNLITSMLVKYVSPAPVSIDANAKFQYRNLLWVGAGYRLNDGFSGMVGLNISPALSLGYSYDSRTASLLSGGVRTHEIVIGFNLGNKYNEGCPGLRW